MLRLRPAALASRRLASRSLPVRRKLQRQAGDAAPHGSPSADALPGHEYISSAAARRLATERMSRASAALREAMHSREEMRRQFAQALNERSRRIAAGSLGALALLGGVVYVYRKQAKEAVVEELSDVATKTLSDSQMQQQAAQVTMATLQALLEDRATVERAAEFLTQLAEHPGARAAVVALLVDALKRKEVLQEALALTLWVLDDERCREHLVGALVAALATDTFRAAAGEFAVHWLARDEVCRPAQLALRSPALTRARRNSGARGGVRLASLGVAASPRRSRGAREHGRARQVAARHAASAGEDGRAPVGGSARHPLDAEEQVGGQPGDATAEAQDGDVAA